MLFSTSLAPLLCALCARAAITVYYTHGQTPLGASPTNSADAASYSGAAAYNPTVLTPPPLPNPLPPTQFDIALAPGAQVTGLSIPQTGSFFGFSIEFSVVNQVLGKNSTFIQVPFLNLMANLKDRGGSVHVRVGGNTQETATLVDSLPDGKSLEKDLAGASNPTQTPPLVFTPEIIYMMGNISSFIGVRWYMGIPFNDTTNWRLAIATQGQALLGDYLIGLQAGNEPDLYVRHGHRQQPYGPTDYNNELSSLIQALSGPENDRNREILIGPNIATGDWTPEMVWDTGFTNTFKDNLAALAVEHYPTDNCFAQFGVGTNRSGQDVFPDFLQHTSGQNIVKPYVNSGFVAQAAGKPLLMFETNTASCGGFPGLSDSFGAALWGVDYALQMAYSNFSGALFHVGGQNVFYNPFTPPPTNQSSFHQWTIGPLYYSALAVSETFGISNKSQIIDLFANNANIYTPAYAIYENGAPTRVALFNYMTDPSGASDLTVTISGGGSSSVQVKYLQAPSVSTKGNLTWAGQTFGGNFASDGRPQGTESIQTVSCNPNCPIKVPAPSFALVFLTSQALSDSHAQTTETFSTSIHTKTRNTATVDPAVLATSNGHKGFGDGKGSTSRGKSSSGGIVSRYGEGIGWSLLVMVVAGVWMFGRTW